MKAITKNNHFIPQFILRNFVDEDNKIYHFSKVKRDWKSKRSEEGLGLSTKKTAQQYHLYTTEENGTATDIFEQRLSHIETDIAPVIKKLLAEKTKITKLETLLSPNEMGLLIFFLTISLRRTPTYLKYINKHFIAALDTVDTSDDFFQEKDREYIKREKDKTVIHNNFTIPFIFNEEQVEKLFISLFEYQWFIFSATTIPGNFLLGDTLVSFLKLPINEPNNEVYVPIGKNHILFGVKCEGDLCERVFNVDRHTIKKINEYVIGNADEYVFCSTNKSNLKAFILKTIDSKKYCNWECLFPFASDIQNTHKMKDIKE